MHESELVSYLKANIEPLNGMGWETGLYRCSVTLTDGLFLPCVAFKSRGNQLDLAIRRFAETIKDKNQYRTLVEIFACSGNRVSDYNIQSLHPSRYAIPKARMLEIRGETSMSWTQFTVTMSDGSEFQFGTAYSTEFFEMPEQYSGTDIALVTPAERFTKPQLGVPIFREKPFFECYIDGL